MLVQWNRQFHNMRIRGGRAQVTFDTLISSQHIRLIWVYLRISFTAHASNQYWPIIKGERLSSLSWVFMLETPLANITLTLCPAVALKLLNRVIDHLKTPTKQSKGGMREKFRNIITAAHWGRSGRIYGIILLDELLDVCNFMINGRLGKEQKLHELSALARSSVVDPMV